MKTNSTNVILVSAYRPPNTTETSFLEDLKKLLDKIKKESKNIIIGIDQNMDLLKIDTHKHTQELLELTLEYDMLPSITKPTRISHTSATLIDNIYISQNLQKNFESNILTEDISDHLPCLLIAKKVQSASKEPIEYTCRKLDEKNIKLIQEKLDSINWDSVLTGETCNDAFNCFHSELTLIIDEIAPEKTHLIRPNSKTLREPWLTKGLLKCIKKQKKLYSDSIRHRSNPDTRKTYVDYRNCLKRVTRRSKIMHYQEKCIEFKDNTKKLWGIINDTIHKNNNKNDVIEYLTINGIKNYQPDQITNEFAEYFANVGKTFAHKIKESKKSINAYIKAITRHNKSIFMRPTDINEIRNILRNLLNKNSSGPDNISNTILKKLAEQIVKPMTIIINKSISEGVFPEKMKLADVVPLHKSKSRDNTSNYRPISLLMTLSKLLEKVIYKRTYDFLNTNGQIFNSQYGFRSNHSCENAVSELIGEIVKGLDQKKKTIAVFLDLSKAFDTLKHKILLEKLERYGIRGTALKWFESYLHDRKLRTKCTTGNSGKIEYSDIHKIEYGTPQGSCLGPLLFLIFSNDLHLHIEYCNCILFADDTTLYYTHRNTKLATWCLEHDLKILSDWFRSNKLTLNVSKSVMIHFNSKNNNENVKLSIDNIALPGVTSTKFLGVWLDNKLDWHVHLNNLLLKIKRNINLLRLGKNLLNIATKKILYYAQIYSHLTYGLTVWGNMSYQQQRTKLQKTQDTCVALIAGNCQRATYQKLKILNVDELIKLQHYKYVHKLIYRNLPVKLQLLGDRDSKNLSLKKEHSYNTRNKAIPNLPNTNSQQYKKSFMYQGLKDFMYLPSEIRQLKKYEVFVTACKKHLLTL